uniref:Ymf74 n=1 Tax=Tetrahymena paravorax TaxID=5905 RepID=Q09F74_TETPR|nr:Ymf74 [Tetrahymena paravorax]ABI51677.1 Ymf74 [Tetrahymena paravorax]
MSKFRNFKIFLKNYNKLNLLNKIYLSILNVNFKIKNHLNTNNNIYLNTISHGLNLKYDLLQTQIIEKNNLIYNNYKKINILNYNKNIEITQIFKFYSIINENIILIEKSLNYDIFDFFYFNIFIFNNFLKLFYLNSYLFILNKI